MRLGQLARKLEIRPTEIVEFLAAKHIQIEDGTNTKMDDSHVALVLQHFSPATDLKDFSEDEPTIAPDLIQTLETVEPPKENPEIQSDVQDEAQPQQSEVIKAPKIELSGLKVLGKIELPETKKRETGAEENAAPDFQKDLNKEKRNADFRNRQRQPKNPIALQREQEALEAMKKREEEIKLQKIKRTENYLKKVKSHQPTKAARIIREQTIEMSAAELEEPPKSWLGKLIKWFTT